VLSAWKGRDARTIEAHEVIELLDGIVERGSNVMANRVAGILGQMFKFGIHRRIVDASPVQLLYRQVDANERATGVCTHTDLTSFLKNPLTCTRYARLAQDFPLGDRPISRVGTTMKGAPEEP
jgi:hypothetical protein